MSIQPKMVSLCGRLLVISAYRTAARQHSSVSSVDPNEIANFNSLSDQWWDEGGEFKPLHSMNALRVPFIRNGLIHSGSLPRDASTRLMSLAGLKILDVGCGGGILSEPLARIGAQVTGLDASAEAVRTAREHAALDPALGARLQYVLGSLEELQQEGGEAFDAVVASEVIEHMTSPGQCVALCAALLKPGGSLFVTTLSRSTLSWLGGVVLAEHVLRIVPPGTHDWNKFCTPLEIKNMLDDQGCSTRMVHGMAYNPVSNSWCWTANTAINYALHAVKSQPSSSSDSG